MTPRSLAGRTCDDLSAPAAPQTAPLPQQKIRIKLKSFEHLNLTESCKKIVETATQTGATVAGPVPLPTRRRLYCVLRSPHVNKNSMEHFQILTHQRLIDLKNPTAQTIDALMQLDLPAGAPRRLRPPAASLVAPDCR